MRRMLMTVWLMLAAVAAGFSAVAAHAEELPIPSQAAWADAKKMVKLPNGLSLAYVEMGDTGGKPTLLIHGYTDNSRSWSLIAPYLKGRHLLAIDLRGHGKSDAPACCYAYTDFANDAALFLDAMGVAKADVIGHSLGSLTGAAAGRAASRQGRPRRADLVHHRRSAAVRDRGCGTMSPSSPRRSTRNSQFMKDWYANPNPVDEDYITRERTESAATPIHVWIGVLWGTVDRRPDADRTAGQGAGAGAVGRPGRAVRPQPSGEAGEGLSRTPTSRSSRAPGTTCSGSSRKRPPRSSTPS